MGFLSSISKAFGYGPRATDTSLILREQAPALQLIPSHKLRSYDAALPTAATADWLVWSTSGSYETLSAWRRICAMARDLERNNPHARAFLRELCLNVIGSTGIRLQPRVKNLKGANLNTKLNSNVGDAWKEFRTKGNYEVTGQFSGIQADELILRALARDGGCLLRLYRGYPNKQRFAVQLLEIDSLDLTYTKSLGSGRSVTTGVETDQFGKPVAYHLLNYCESDIMANNTLGQRIRVPASDLIHIWLPERITSVRGMSWFASVLFKLRMLDKYEEATSVAARTTASKMGFLEREKDAGKYEGQGKMLTGEVVEEISPGSVIELPPGVKFVGYDPGSPSDTYKDFRKSILRTVASGLGSMYNSLANDLESVNYSSARFGREIEVEFWKALQRFYIESVLQPVFDAWSECAVMSGTLSASFEQIPNIQSSMVWRPRSWPYIDPVKDISAAISAVSFGLSTRSRELAEVGLDVEEVFEELAFEKSLEEKYDLTFVDPVGRNPNESTQEDASKGTGDTVPDATEAPPPAKK